MEKPFNLNQQEAEIVLRVAKIVAPNLTRKGIEYDYDKREFITSDKQIPVMEFMINYFVHKAGIYLAGKQFPLPLEEQNRITNEFWATLLDFTTKSNAQFIPASIRYINKAIPTSATV